MPFALFAAAAAGAWLGKQWLAPALVAPPPVTPAPPSAVAGFDPDHPGDLHAWTDRASFAKALAGTESPRLRRIATGC